METRCEAVVVGGGFAGVTAARELRFRGVAPVVLEARERLGGRTMVADLAGEPVEMGGQSVHWFNAHLWAELTRYGIGISENEPWETFVFWEQGAQRRYTRAQAGLRLKRLFEQFFDGIGGAITRPFDPLHQRDAISRLDGMSIAGRLAELDLSPDDRDWLRAFLSAISGWPVERAGLVLFLRMWALGAWSVERLFDMMGRYAIEGGTSRLHQAIAEDARADIRLGEPVVRIESLDGGVRVTTCGGASFLAPVCIVATPVNLWPHIEFSPGLSEEKMSAAREGVAAPAFTKIWALASGRPEHVFAVYPPDRAITQLRVDRPRSDGRRPIVAFSTDPKLDPGDHALIRRAIAEVLPEVGISEILTKCWHRDEYARGAFGWMQPHQLVRYQEALQQPEGRLFFATSDLADGPGGMGGAIETGLRAARLALTRLRS